MTRILCIGMGGVGVIVSYGLLLNPEVEVTAVVRSAYTKVTEQGYTISSVDYGGRRNNDDPNEAENAIKGFRPHKVVKALSELKLSDPFDYIVVSTKCIPLDNNVWDDVEQAKSFLIKPNRGTSIVLVQNGIDIEQYWDSLAPEVNLISGVSYISSTNIDCLVTQYGTDISLYGLFDFTRLDDLQAKQSLSTFVELLSNPYNSISIDHNTRLTRWKKLLYNASFNSVCCLTKKDVGQLFEAEGFTDRVIVPMMEQVMEAANDDLQRYDYGEHNGLISRENITFLMDATRKSDAVNNYRPSMLVDALHGRPIELEIIMGNIVRIYGKNNPGQGDDKISKLRLVYDLLAMQN
ncbi:uncharacterized protein CANTADRAFT_43487 [Suhomyces tanzawaensis NRRL Y-17324]|uniref:2-dehydropantoate 2-reductase n=1 Tax=Suhomyces tanzawaensis NRRL Y-17324 TaxID=984487 RepID=A0A1E4SPZ4_9ASCO|nr:uncharacterized protein CANTADRAFT_43487 [Suhomyces tanzawaensis NRRL Y-17324]ODV81580.1 hypothetical protein CANTADRAFT_43487 [Suhomyces tanzawaensis NRRL Y-17324]